MKSIISLQETTPPGFRVAVYEVSIEHPPSRWRKTQQVFGTIDLALRTIRSLVMFDHWRATACDDGNGTLVHADGHEITYDPDVRCNLPYGDYVFSKVIEAQYVLWHSKVQEEYI